MKKNYLLLFLFYSFITIYSSAQSLTWAKQITGPANISEGHSMCSDASGNVYGVGTFLGTVDFDPGASVFNMASGGFGSPSIYIYKLDASGSFVWARQIDLIGLGPFDNFSIALESGGNNIIIAGSFNSPFTVDFDPGSGVDTLRTAGLADIFIAKYTSAGAHVWAKRIGSTSYDGLWDMVLDASDNIYLTGRFSDIMDCDPGAGVSNITAGPGEGIFVCKFNSSGGFVFGKGISDNAGGGGASQGIAVDASGNVCIAGWFSGTVDFDPGAGTYNLTSITGGVSDIDIFVCKLNSSGNFAWVKQMGGNAYDQANSITVDASGNVYTTGKFVGTADFDPSGATANLTAGGSGDVVFVSKLDASGNYVWAKHATGNLSTFGKSILLDATGNVYTTGYYQGAIDFDPGNGTTTLTAAGSKDIFVWKLDAAGNLGFAASMGGTSDEEGLTVSRDGSNNIYVSGAFGGTADFDPGSGVVNLISSSNDIYVVKLGSCAPSAAGSITGTTSLCSGAGVTYSISAVSGATGYTWTVPAGATINSGQNTTSINVTFGGTSGNVAVTPTNTCGSGASGTLTVTVTPPPTVSFAIASFIINTASPVSLSGSPSGGTFNGPGVSGSTFNPAIAGLGNKQITYTYTGGNNCTNSASNIVTVYDTSGGNCIDTTHIIVHDTIQTSISVTDTLVINVNLTGIAPPNNTNAVTVYPNPAHDHLIVNNGNLSTMTGYSIKITNALGQIVFNQTVNQQQFYIDLNTFGGNGTYILYVLDAQQTVKSVKEIVLQ